MVLVSFALGLGLFAATLIAAATIALWRFVAARSERLSWIVPVVGVVLVAGCFLPTERQDDVRAISGHAAGGAWIPVQAGGAAQATTTGGSASIQRLPNGTFLVLDCPGGCDFQGGTGRDDPARSLGVDAGAATFGTATGQLHVVDATTRCDRLPFLVGLSLAPTCVACASDAYEADADGRIQGEPSGLC